MMRTTSHRFHSRFGSATALAAMLGLAGCAAPLNSSVPITPGEPVPIRQGSAAPSLHGTLSREHWPGRAVGWMPGRVEHHPTYVSSLALADDSHRRSGHFPTVESVSQVEEDDAALALEAARAVPHAAFLFVRAPVEVILWRFPWNVETSGRTGYEAMPKPMDDRAWLGIRPAAGE